MKATVEGSARIQNMVTSQLGSEEIHFTNYVYFIDQANKNVGIINNFYVIKNIKIHELT